MTYEVRESTRARHLRVTVHADGRVVLTKPKRVPKLLAHAFMKGRWAWVEEARARLNAQKERTERRLGPHVPVPRLRRGTTAYAHAITQARVRACERTAHWAALGQFRYGSISIRNQKTRWGSCSRPRRASLAKEALCNLSFNYRLIYLPPQLLDYLIVHELAHTRQHNHSKAFWAEVGNLIPDYAALRKELTRYRW